LTDQTAPRGLVLRVDADSALSQATLKALASGPRLRILELLSDRILNVSEVATLLGMPLSTATLHLNILQEAGLLLTEQKPASRGSQKVCARAYDTVLVQLPQGRHSDQQLLEMAMPVGAYVDCQVTPSCGLASDSGIIGLFDDPASFYEADRLGTQLLWFHHGYVEYRFPNRLPPKAFIHSLHLSFEACSEAPLHHENWPSDITVWINDVEVGCWTSPGDFGGQRGALTPEWWESQNSQYGLLKVWQVNGEGSLVDGIRVSDVRVGDLRLPENEYISVRIGVKEDARHVGGLNLFGRAFGNYPQDLVLRLRHED
jgi:predicted transcriptional regulator